MKCVLFLSAVFALCCSAPASADAGRSITVDSGWVMGGYPPVNRIRGVGQIFKNISDSFVSLQLKFEGAFIPTQDAHIEWTDTIGDWWADSSNQTYGGMSGSLGAKCILKKSNGVNVLVETITEIPIS